MTRGHKVVIGAGYGVIVLIFVLVFAFAEKSSFFIRAKPELKAPFLQEDTDIDEDVGPIEFQLENLARRIEILEQDLEHKRSVNGMLFPICGSVAQEAYPEDYPCWSEGNDNLVFAPDSDNYAWPSPF